MSIDKVLEMPPRVQDLVEVPTKKQEPWDIVPLSDIISEASALAMNCSILYPSISQIPEALAIGERIGRDLDELEFDEEFDSSKSRWTFFDPTIKTLNECATVFFLTGKRSSASSVLEGMMLNSLDRIIVRADGPKIAAQAKAVFYTNDRILRHITPVIAEYLGNAQIDYSTVQANQLFNINSLERIAFARLANPDYFLFDETDFTETPLYKWAVSELPKLSGDGMRQARIAVASSLKILAAKRVDIREKGFVLTMSDSSQEAVSSSELPETRRFGNGS